MAPASECSRRRRSARPPKSWAPGRPRCSADGRRVRLTFVGHSTVLIELDGVRILTDPQLRGRFLHVERRAPPVDLAAVGDIGPRC